MGQISNGTKASEDMRVNQKWSIQPKILRKLPIETGEELASVLTRDAARCIYFEKEYIYAFLNKRVLKLDRNNVCD